jgi:hypothetical protein
MSAGIPGRDWHRLENLPGNPFCFLALTEMWGHRREPGHDDSPKRNGPLAQFVRADGRIDSVQINQPLGALREARRTSKLERSCPLLRITKTTLRKAQQGASPNRQPFDLRFQEPLERQVAPAELPVRLS